MRWQLRQLWIGQPTLQERRGVWPDLAALATPDLPFSEAATETQRPDTFPTSKASSEDLRLSWLSRACSHVNDQAEERLLTPGFRRQARLTNSEKPRPGQYWTTMEEWRGPACLELGLKEKNEAS